MRRRRRFVMKSRRGTRGRSRTRRIKRYGASRGGIRL